MEDDAYMKWTERDLQDYRKDVCSEQITTNCEECTKTKEEIASCYWDLFEDL